VHVQALAVINKCFVTATCLQQQFLLSIFSQS